MINEVKHTCIYCGKITLEYDIIFLAAFKGMCTNCYENFQEIGNLVPVIR